MDIKIPVYTDQYGYHQINVWKQASNGMFHRTSEWLMPHLLINFSDLSESLGEMVSPAYVRRHYEWQSPTAYNYMGRPSSLFHFLRTEAKKRKIHVLTAATMSGRAYKFSINELRFKHNVSTAVKVLTARNFLDAIKVFINIEQNAEMSDAGIAVSHSTGATEVDEYYAAIMRQSLPLAEQGDANAQYTVGYIYEKGQGTEQDFSAAIRWYRKAADANYLPAQAHLGALYASGKGAPQNDVLAYFWFTQVANRGVKSASELRRKFASRMSSAQKAAARKLIADWQPNPGTSPTQGVVH